MSTKTPEITATRREKWKIDQVAEIRISREKLTEVAKTPAKLGFIEMQRQKIVKVNQRILHFGPHQVLLKNLCLAHLAKVAENEKESFMYTIAADEAAIEKIRERYRLFIREVEKIVGQSRPQQVYQLNYDLFKWL